MFGSDDLYNAKPSTITARPYAVDPHCFRNDVGRGFRWPVRAWLYGHVGVRSWQWIGWHDRLPGGFGAVGHGAAFRCEASASNHASMSSFISRQVAGSSRAADIQKPRRSLVTRKRSVEALLGLIGAGGGGRTRIRVCAFMPPFQTFPSLIPKGMMASLPEWGSQLCHQRIVVFVVSAFMTEPSAHESRIPFPLPPSSCTNSWFSHLTW